MIRDDGKIEAADPTIATCTGALKARFDGATLLAEAASGDPVAIEYGFTMAEGWSLSFELFRTFLPKPKYSITGPVASRPASAGAPPSTRRAARCCG